MYKGDQYQVMEYIVFNLVKAYPVIDTSEDKFWTHSGATYGLILARGRNQFL